LPPIEQFQQTVQFIYLYAIHDAMQLAGKPYELDPSTGEAAANRPELMQRLTILAQNPTACARYFHLFLQVSMISYTWFLEHDPLNAKSVFPTASMLPQ
jgi:hypothetical protein